MLNRSTSPRASDRLRTRRPKTVRPELQTLEDRSVPAGASWALPADPEGYVFHDINGNSIMDGGESAVGAGWSVYVDDNNNNLLDAGEINTLTDANGHYNIFLPDGTYSIKVLPQGAFQTDARAFGTLVRDFNSIENGTTSEGPFNYSGLAWANDSLYVTFTHLAGADNVMYQVDPQSGAAIGSAVSIPAEIGEISFDGTDFWGADYRNDLIIRFNFAGQELQRLSFAGMHCNSVEWDGTALRVLDNIAHRIYRIDPSGSGTILGSIGTPNENVVGLSFDGTSLWVTGRDNPRVYALDPATGVVKSSFTEPGSYAYGLAVRGTNLWMSDNRLSRIFQYDLGFGGGRIVTIAGADVTGVNLAVFQPAAVSGRVFIDKNQNGVKDVADHGMPGWRIYFDANGNGQYDGWESSAVSNSSGNYTLSGLRPGNYSMREDLAAQFRALPRWQQTSPAGPAYSPLTVSSGDLLTGRDFANYLDRVVPSPTDWSAGAGGRLNLFTGLEWFDESTVVGGSWSWSPANTAANNGTFNGYDDWRLPTLTESLAAARGQAAVAAGFLGDKFGPQVPYWTSTPGAKIQGRQTYWVVHFREPSRDPSQEKDTNLALLMTVRDTAKYVDDGNSGFSQIGTWSTTTGGNKPKPLTGYLGDARTAANTGSATATWSFTGLELGATYKVAATWTNASGYATNAPFTVLDNTTSLGTIAINQANAPNDFEVSGQNWEGLGIFTTTSGTLNVKLSNTANGTVMADGVRIFRVYPGFDANPLTAAGGAAARTNAPALTSKSLQPIVREAIRRWNLTGLTSTDRTLVRSVHFEIANLDGATLGLALANRITLDRNAAGYGWFVDPTPRSDSEFYRSGDQGEQGQIDLLTTVMHELGHVIGRNHAASGVMSETLTTGTRESVVPGVHLGRGLPTARASWFLTSSHRRR